MTKKSKILGEATDSVKQRIDAMLEQLKSEGIKKKDFKTTSYSVRPEYDWKEEGSRVFSGYRVEQGIEIKIRDLDKVEDVLGKVSLLEVDNVSGLSFFMDDDKTVREALRREAIKDARVQAKKLTKDLGVSLGEIVSFGENSEGYPIEPRFAYSEMSMDAAAGGGMMKASIPVGENEMTSKISITYKIDN